MSAIVVVHPKVDLDACLCVVLAGAGPEEVHFVPAGVTEIPEICPCCGKKIIEPRVLDHPLGEKGRLDEDGTRHCAAASMPEATNAAPELLAEVEEQDSTGKVERPRFSLPQILQAVRREAEARGLSGAALDRAVIAAMAPILRGLNLLYQEEQAARELLPKLRIELVGGCKFAILPVGKTPPQLSKILAEETDVSCEIYWEVGPGVFNLGIYRYPGRITPDLRELKPYLPGWFVHSAGFLACWGNAKSPETTPPPSGTPQSQEELLALVKRVFG